MNPNFKRNRSQCTDHGIQVPDPNAWGLQSVEKYRIKPQTQSGHVPHSLLDDFKVPVAKIDFETNSSLSRPFIFHCICLTDDHS
jgi:hypothetical protein